MCHGEGVWPGERVLMGGVGGGGGFGILVNLADTANIKK